MATALQNRLKRHEATSAIGPARCFQRPPPLAVTPNSPAKLLSPLS